MRPPRWRGRRADVLARAAREPLTTVEVRKISDDLLRADVRRVQAALSRVADLESRVAALKARPDARHPGILDNIAGLREELKEARRELLAARVAAGQAGEIVWLRVGRDFLYELPKSDHQRGLEDVARKFGAGGASIRSMGRGRSPDLAVRREGQMEIGYRDGRGRVRVRVRDRYQLLVDGEPVPNIFQTRRNVCRQAHLAAMFGVGFPEPHVRAVLDPPGTPGRSRKISRALAALRRARAQRRESSRARRPIAKERRPTSAALALVDRE